MTEKHSECSTMRGSVDSPLLRLNRWKRGSIKKVHITIDKKLQKERKGGKNDNEIILQKVGRTGN